MKAPKVDIAVIGDGVVGLACALALADAGRTVALVASGPNLGTGQASLAAGAMLTVLSEAEAAHSIERIDLEVGQRMAARHMYEGWLERINKDATTPVSLTPGVWVLAGPDGADDSADLAAIADAAARFGKTAEYHTPGEVPGLHPARGHRAHAALWLPDEAGVDTGTLIGALAAAARIHENITWTPGPAARLSKDAHGLMLVELGNGPTVQAELLLLAAGAGITPLLTRSGLTEAAGLPPVLAGRGASLIVHTPLCFPAPVRTVNRGFACGTHAVPRADGSLYIGGTNRLATEPAARRASLDEISTLIHGAASEINTRLRHAELAATLLGHRPYTLDHLPLIGRTADPRLLVATATYRCGILLAPHLARLTVEEVEHPGALADHPYTATRPMPAPAMSDLLDNRAAAGLIDMLCQPGGTLPPGAEDELEPFLLSCLAAATNPAQSSATVRRLTERAPVAEAIPLIFDAIGRTTR